MMSYVESYETKENMHGFLIQGVQITCVVIQLCSISWMKTFTIQ